MTKKRSKFRKNGERAIFSSLWGNVTLSISLSLFHYFSVFFCSLVFPRTENELLSLSNFLSRFYLKVCNGIHITCNFCANRHTAFQLFFFFVCIGEHGQKIYREKKYGTVKGGGGVETEPTVRGAQPVSWHGKVARRLTIWATEYGIHLDMGTANTLCSFALQNDTSPTTSKKKNKKEI